MDAMPGASATGSGEIASNTSIWTGSFTRMRVHPTTDPSAGTNATIASTCVCRMRARLRPGQDRQRRFLGAYSARS